MTRGTRRWQLLHQFFEDPTAFEQLAWTAGVSYYWNSLTFDALYWETDLSTMSASCVADLPMAATRVWLE